MTKIIVGRDKWKDVYQSKINNCHIKTWIVCALSNNIEIFLLQDDDIKIIKTYCINNNCFIKNVGLKYRSHEVWLDPIDNIGFYIVKSIKGHLNQESQHCIVLGAIVGNTVKKKAFMTPELIVAYEDEDDIDKCFTEALIYNDKKAKAI